MPYFYSICSPALLPTFLLYSAGRWSDLFVDSVAQLAPRREESDAKCMRLCWTLGDNGLLVFKAGAHSFKAVL
jgi:hypothetical protein